MKLMCRRFSADDVVRPSIDEDKPGDPLGRHVADHVIIIPKRRPSTPGNTPSKPSEQHATKNGDISSDTTADETSSTRKGLYSGGVRNFTVDDVRTRKDEVRKAKKSKSKERGEREVKQEEEKKKNPTLSSSCIDVAFIKEKHSKSLSRSAPDINRGRSVSRTRQIDVPRLPFKDKSLNDKKDKIASSTLKGQQVSFHDSSEREHEGRRQEEEKMSLALLSSCTDNAVIKYKRSKSLLRSDPDVIRSRSVTRTRQVDGIVYPQLPFTDDKIASSTLKGQQASFHDRFHYCNAVLKKGHNSSFRDSAGASLSRLRRSESNESPPSPFLLNSERRIRMMKEKSMMTSDANKKGDGWRNQSYQPRSLSVMEYGAVPSRRSSSNDRGRNRITNNIPPRRDVSPNQIDFARHSTKDLKFDSAEEKEEISSRELKLLSRSKSSTDNLSSSMADMSTSTRSSIVFPQRVARSRSINHFVGDSRRSSM